VRKGLELVVLVGEESRTVELPSEGTLSIGRGDGCSVRIEESSVSRSHALLHVGTRLVVEDLGSANGTIIRERAAPVSSDTLTIRHLVAQEAELFVGDTLLFGTACVVVRHAASGDAAAPAGADGDFGPRDPALRAIYAQAARAAPTPLNVLLLGETGVGKEVLARFIHARSLRASGPFHAINCAALNDSLLESELFGHEKGAFTGAVQARAGALEAAAGGTVLLDEVGELTPSAQAKLLRVLEQRVVTRVGSNREVAIDVRFLAATNRDLEADCAIGRFRSDLYFRLNGLSLSIPPLRERPSEVIHLARGFLEGACGSIERLEVPSISDGAMDALRAHGWPGNVRELRHAMERAAVLAPGDAVLLEHLPPAIANSERTAAKPGGLHPTRVAMDASTVRPAQARNLPGEIRSLERVRIVEALERAGGIQSQAARVLGISRRTLISRLEQFGLPRPRKRDRCT
jgi:two-component system response regulator AtoC